MLKLKEPIRNEKPFDYGLMGPQKSDVENKVQIQGGHRCLRVDLVLDQEEPKSKIYLSRQGEYSTST